MISDVQFLAQVLIKIRAGDQITTEETNRLRVTALGGAYSEPFPGQAVYTFPEGATAEQIASATRVGGATIDASS